MRIAIKILCLVLLTGIARAQEYNVFPKFVRSFERNFSVPLHLRQDSCFSMVAFLSIRFLAATKQPVIEYTDQMQVAFAETLPILRDQLETSEIQKAISKQKGGMFLQPILVLSHSTKCANHTSKPAISDKLFSINNQYIVGPILLNKPIVLTLGPAIH